MARALELQPARRLTLEMPVPPSVNALFFNRKSGRGKGRIHTPAYKTWIAEATFDVKRQQVARIDGRYLIGIRFPRGQTKADLGNLEKAISDLLQKLKIIANDNYCDGVSLRWSDKLNAVRVTVMAAGRREN